MKVSLIIISAVVAAVFITASEAADKVVCYYGSWAVYRPGNGKCDVEDIDPRLCTHLIYTFVGIGDDGSVKVLDAWNDLEDNWGKGAFKRFVNLKEINPNAKCMVAIGGWNEGGARFSSVVADPQLRAAFIQNAVAFVKKYNFDGFDLDWEYPAESERGGRPEDKQNFAETIIAMQKAMHAEGYLLTAATSAPNTKSRKYYDSEAMNHLDFINVMTYDFHGAWESVTGQNSPLYASNGDTNPEFNCANSIEGWIASGVDPKKIVMGMGTYGRSFTLASASNNSIGAPTYGGGEAGPYTRQRGILGYNEMVEMEQQGGFTGVWDDEQKVPYAYKGDFWVGYDNIKSIELKCEYIKSMGLGGGMIWSVETDDFRGVSGTKNPLLKTINRVLLGKNF